MRNSEISRRSVNANYLPSKVKATSQIAKNFSVSRLLISRPIGGGAGASRNMNISDSLMATGAALDNINSDGGTKHSTVECASIAVFA